MTEPFHPLSPYIYIYIFVTIFLPCECRTSSTIACCRTLRTMRNILLDYDSHLNNLIFVEVISDAEWYSKGGKNAYSCCFNVRKTRLVFLTIFSRSVGSSRNNAIRWIHSSIDLSGDVSQRDVKLEIN